LNILDVTNPAQIHEIARANISATGPFDFVQSLNDRAILISYRDQTGLAVLDLKKFDRPIVLSPKYPPTPEVSQQRP
jgi:hypothetical protein